MTNEELNTKLYEKLFAEQENFKGWLLTQPPEEILNHAYEYVMREDIVLAMEYHDVTDAQAKALIASPSPLAEIFHDFEKIEGNHMDTIRECIEKRADKNIEAQLAELSLTGLHFIILGLFFGREVSAVSDDVFKPCKGLIPVQLHIGTVGLLQADSLTGAVNPASSRYGVGAAADTVLVLQKVCLFLGVVGAGEIGVNTTFSTLNITATGQGGINFIIGDKHSHARHFRHIGDIFTP